jgi:serine/threonine protein kinase
MDNKLNTSKVLFNKLNDYFKDKIRISLIDREILIIITKEDLFYCIDIQNENIPSFIINNGNSVIESMIIKDLCYKQINDLYIFYDYASGHKHCFARNDNEYNIYYYDIKYEVMKEYISEEKIIDMCCGREHSILLTQSGKVYEYLVNGNERENSEKYIYFKLKSFKKYSFGNEKIVMISCGWEHSLALTESGRVFGWGDNGFRKFRPDDLKIFELNDVKIKKISCGIFHSLFLSRDGDIYAFGSNNCGEIGNGIQNIPEMFPIKLELNNKFIDIASHLGGYISMSKSIDNIYYVWGKLEDKYVLSPQPTKYESFEDILRANNINHIKTFEKLVEFKDSFVKNGFYSKNFEEIKVLGFGAFGTVFRAKEKDKDYFYAIKKIRFNIGNKNEIIREYLNYMIITKKYSKNEMIRKIVTNKGRIEIYGQNEYLVNILTPGLKKVLFRINREFLFTFKWNYAIKH